MISIDRPIFLASQSPRRKELLTKIFGNVKVISVEADESTPPNKAPSEVAVIIAQRKMDIAKSINREKSIVITADTIVSFGEIILGKPKSKEDAYLMMKLLSGNTHQVFTGYAIFDTETKKQINGVEETQVTFNSLAEQDIHNYIQTNSPMDKAGGYGIQDAFGSIFVQSINGCYYNVMGLPVSKIYKAIQKLNYDRKS